MSDFDDNWQIVGAIPGYQIPDNTPQEQPAVQEPTVQQAEPAVSPVQVQPVAQPVQPQPVAAPVTMAQPFASAMQQPPQYQPSYQVPGQPNYQVPAQPNYQNPGYAQVQPQPGMPVYGGYVQPAYQNAAVFAAERDKNLNECNRMINHFSPKVDVYQKYEKCIYDISRYSKTSVAPLVWGIILGCVALLWGIYAFSSKYKDTIITNAVIAGIFLLACGGLITLFILKKKGHAKKKEELYTTLGEISNELNLIYNGYSNCVLPPEFTDPRILFKIQSLIISGRCVTINNALNAMLSVSNVYMRLNDARTKFQAETADRFDGKPLFFNAVRFLNLR